MGADADYVFTIRNYFNLYRDLMARERAPGSSLDPSADAGTHLTTRLGFDLTAPLESTGKSFRRAAFPEVDIKKFGL